VDAIATPFVQGRLRKKALSATIRTECKCCAKPFTLAIDSELNYRIEEGPTAPLVFAPFVDFDKLKEPNIIDAF
jgi:hypothetical protein